jgi:DNA-binding transcriptional LysR family regulator
MTNAHTVGTAVLPAREVLGQQKGKPRSRRAMSLTPESARLMKSARGQLNEAENAAQDADKFEFSHRAALRTFINYEKIFSLSNRRVHSCH